MIINIQFMEMTFSEALTESVIGRLNKLGEQYKWILKAKVVFKDENPGKKGKVCEIELSTPGTRLFAFAREKDFEPAIRDSVMKLEKQFARKKGFSNFSTTE